MRQSEETIKRACAYLEAQGSIRTSGNASNASGHAAPGYVTSQPEASIPQDDESVARDKIVKTVLRATVAVFRSNLKVGIKLAGSELKDDQETTEDLSIFIRVSGRLDGSICFGLSRKVARELVETITRQRVTSFDQNGIRVLNALADRVVQFASAELQTSGSSIKLWPASTVHPAGMRITTLGVSQVVTTLNSQLGPIVVHIVLRDTPVEEELAA